MIFEKTFFYHHSLHLVCPARLIYLMNVLLWIFLFLCQHIFIYPNMISLTLYLQMKIQLATLSWILSPSPFYKIKIGNPGLVLFTKIYCIYYFLSYFFGVCCFFVYTIFIFGFSHNSLDLILVQIWFILKIRFSKYRSWIFSFWCHTR